MEKEIYYTRVLPLVRYIVKKDKNGKEYTDVIDNLSREERLSLSEEKARMLWNNGTDLYVAEQPLSYHEGMSIKFSIVYLFDELSKEEQTKYYERTIVLPLTIKPVVKIYDDNSKRFFPKRKSKIKKEDTK